MQPRSTATTLALLAWLLLPTVSPLAQNPETKTNDEITEDEYAVYGAVLQRLSVEGMLHHPLVSDRTSTFECGSTCNGLLVGKCSGMRSEEVTPKEMLTRISRQIDSLARETTRDFEEKNQKCYEVRKLLAGPVRHFLFSQTTTEDLPEDWQHPDLLYFSRVGFDTGKKQALVYAALTSGTDARFSGGYYFLVGHQDAEWEVEKGVRVWSLVH